MRKLLIGSGVIGTALAMAAMSRPVTIHIDEGSNTAQPEPGPPPVSETRQQRRARERALAKSMRKS